MFKTNASLLMIFLIIAMGLISACQPRLTSVELSAYELGQVGARIHLNSQQADQILDKNGLTMEEFRDALDEISTAPELSEHYSRGFESVVD